MSEILNEIDDIARATLGSITIATMRKLIDRREIRPRSATKSVASHQRCQPRA